MSKENKSAKDEVLITYRFKAPVELVFKAWTDPEYLKRWFAPDGCTIQYVKLDISEGGTFHSCIRNPEFGDCWCIGTYHEISKNKKIAYTIAIADEHGNRVQPVSVGMDPEWPAETRVTLTFKDLDGETELILRQTVSEVIAKRTGAHPSWIQMLERLEEITLS